MSCPSSTSDSEANYQATKSTDVHFVDSDFGGDFLHGLEKFRQSQQFTDVTLKAGGLLLPCHRVVLAAASPYFNAMFTSGFHESASQIVELKNIDHPTMKAVVGYVYSGELVLTSENVQSLVPASCEYQFDRLKEACEKFMLQQLGSVNCISFSQFAKLYNLKLLQEEARAMILREFCSLQELSELTEAELVEYISDCNLVAQSEDEVFEAVTKWVEFDQPLRRVAFKRVLAHVRLPFCTSSFLQEVVKSEPLMSARICQRYLQEALKIQSMPSDANKPKTNKQRAIPRKSVGVKRRLVLVEGPPDDTKCWYFNDESATWCLLTDVPEYGSYSICVIPNGLMMTCGGYIGPGDETDEREECWLFDIADRKWRAVPSTICARYGFTSVEHRGNVYAIGGEQNGPMASVECFNKNTERWEEIVPMKKAVIGPMAISFGNSLYVFGGCVGDMDEFSTATQEYNTVWGRWTSKADMPDTCSKSNGGTAAMNDRIFVITGCVETWMYDPALDSWTVLTRSNSWHYGGAVVAWKGKMLLWGGKDDEDPDSAAVEEYDPDTDTWSESDIPLKENLRHGKHHLFCMDLPQVN